MNQGLLVAAVRADRGQPHGSALVAQKHDAVATRPVDLPYMALEPRQQVAVLTAVGTCDHQSTLARVIDAVGADKGKPIAARAPDHWPELAGRINSANLTPVESDNPDLREHQRVVDQFVRRNPHRQPIAGR